MSRSKVAKNYKKRVIMPTPIYNTIFWTRLFVTVLPLYFNALSDEFRSAELLGAQPARASEPRTGAFCFER